MRESEARLILLPQLPAASSSACATCGLLKETMRRAARRGRVSVRDEGVSGRLTRLDLQDLVAARPVEALQDSSHMRLVNGENSRLCKLDAPSPLTPEVAVITQAQTHPNPPAGRCDVDVHVHMHATRVG